MVAYYLLDNPVTEDLTDFRAQVDWQLRSPCSVAH